MATDRSLGEQLHDSAHCNRGGKPHLGPCIASREYRGPTWPASSRIGESRADFNARVARDGWPGACTDHLVIDCPDCPDEAEAWGGRGPSASYAEWVAEGRKPERGHQDHEPGPGVRCPECGALPDEQHREECPERDSGPVPPSPWGHAEPAHADDPDEPTTREIEPEPDGWYDLPDEP